MHKSCGDNLREVDSMPVVPSAPSDGAITIWDQPNGAGHSLSLTGMGRANLADFPLDPQNPGVGTWDHNIRSYRANGTHGSFRTGPPARRHEQFGPNFEIVNAGIHAHNATEIGVVFLGWDQWIQAGSIVSFGNLGIFDVPDVPYESPVCWDVLPTHKDEYGAPLVLSNDCASRPGSPAQKWEWRSDGTLHHVASGLCLDTTGKVIDSGYWRSVLVLKEPNQRSSQQFSWDRYRKFWTSAYTGDPITLLGGWPPRVGNLLSVDYEWHADWDQMWLPYFYDTHGQWDWY